MTRTTPFRLIILHLSHILLILVRTFMIRTACIYAEYGPPKNERHRVCPAVGGGHRCRDGARADK